MTMRERIAEWRHIAYRAKVKHIYQTGAHAWLRSKLWPLATEADGVEEIYRRDRDVFTHFHVADIGDKIVRNLFAEENRIWARQSDIILRARGRVVVEPRFGLAWVADRKFIEHTRGGAHKILVPPLSAVWHGRLGGPRLTHYPAAIHFDGFLGANLYHFFAEGLQPYLLMKESGLVDMSLPTIIGRKVYERPYVQNLLSLPCFEHTNWRVLDSGDYIAAEELYKGVSSFAYFQNSYDLLTPRVRKNPRRRIFLDRKSAVQRRLINSAEVFPILAQHGFEIVCAEDLSYSQQAQLFAETRYVVGLHGAGLTNLLYSDIPRLRALELTSSDLIQTHFYWMNHVIGVEHHDVLLGSPFDINWNFAVEPERLRERLEVLLAA